MADKEEEKDVFDQAIENTHPIFHGYLKAAKQHAIASRQFSKFVEDWGKETGVKNNND